MKIAVIGLGLMGSRRVQVARSVGDDIVCGFDPNALKVASLNIPNVQPEDILSNSDVEAVIIATPHNFLRQYAIAALDHGKHVFVEKPCGANFTEVREIADKAMECRRSAVEGFTLRHHPAILTLKESMKQIGDVEYARMVYGHGRLGQRDDDWRVTECGELLDQGCHLVNLTQFLLGDIATIDLWTDREIEHAAIMSVKGHGFWHASLHASWLEWEPTFRVEIIGSKGMVTLNGLHGAYKTPKLRVLNRAGVVQFEANWLGVDLLSAALETEWSEAKRLFETRSFLCQAVAAMWVIDRAKGKI